VSLGLRCDRAFPPIARPVQLLVAATRAFAAERLGGQVKVPHNPSPSVAPAHPGPLTPPAPPAIPGIAQKSMDVAPYPDNRLRLHYGRSGHE